MMGASISSALLVPNPGTIQRVRMVPKHEASCKYKSEIECASFQNLPYWVPIIRILHSHWRAASCIGSSFKAIPCTVT